jgi:HSP20 family protein
MKLSSLSPIVSNKDLFFPFYGNKFNSLFNETVLPSVELNFDFKPSVNLLETEKAFEISLALPGIKKEEVKIDLNDNTLTISGERNSQKEDSKGNWHYTEIRQGKFSRSFQIPENILSENIEANFKDGMLEIVLPKAEPKQAKAITIK